MPPLQKALTVVGVAKQSAKGTAAANPTFSHGITDGGIVKVDIDQDSVDATSGRRVAAHADRTAVVGGFEFTSRCIPRPTGLWLFGALGAKAVSGSGPYTHTLTDAAALPYLTVWGSLDGQLVAIQDCIVDELEISWDEANPPEMKVSGMGGLINFAPTFVPVTDCTTDQHLLAAGGTYKSDITTAVPAIAPVKGGSWSVKNNASPVPLSASVVPSEIFPGRQDFEVGLTLVPTDITPWRALLTGSAAGTTVAEKPVYGSYEQLFNDGAAASLKLQALRVPYTADFPDGDPSGGYAELEIGGAPVQPTGGGVTSTATLINTQATY